MSRNLKQSVGKSPRDTAWQTQRHISIGRLAAILGRGRVWLGGGQTREKNALLAGMAAGGEILRD